MLGNFQYGWKRRRRRRLFGSWFKVSIIRKSLPNKTRSHSWLAKHVWAKPPPKCFVSSWVFHIISHYLKSIDSYTKLSGWSGDLLSIIFTWKMSVNVKVVTSQWWRHVFCHFWSLKYAYFLQCVRKSTSRGVETLQNFVYIIKIEWNMAFLNMKNNSAKYRVPPLRKIPKLEP